MDLYCYGFTDLDGKWMFRCPDNKDERIFADMVLRIFREMDVQKLLNDKNRLETGRVSNDYIS